MQTIERVRSDVEELEPSLHEFYQANKELHSHLISLTSDLYSFQKKLLPTKNGLPSLLTAGFDDEQIWQQIQTYQQPLVDDFSNKLDLFNKKDLKFVKDSATDLEMMNGADEDAEEEEEEGEIDERALKRIMANTADSDDEDGGAVDDEDDDELMPDDAGRDHNESPENQIEYDFRPEDNIDEFITKMEDDLDALDELEENEDETEEDRRAMKALYGDGVSDDDEDDEEEDVRQSRKSKTLFQKHQEEMLAHIEQMEDENMKEKEWQKRGEATTASRPVNSLLEEDLIFDHQSKSKPIITEEVTQDLESIIISRIISGIFDDPEKPDSEDKRENAQAAVELQQEKSKKSLAEIYEQMYLKKVEGKDVDVDIVETDPLIKQERNKIKRMVANTLYALNKMSSFNFVAPPIAEFEDIDDGSKMKPIDVKTTKQQEEEKNVAREIIAPVKNLPTAGTELTKEERKRKRRDTKERAKKKAKKAKELVDLVNPSVTGDKKKNEKLLKELTDKNEVTKSKEVDPNATNYSSSKRFFELMQQKSQEHSTNAAKEKKDKAKKANQTDLIKTRL